MTTHITYKHTATTFVALIVVLSTQAWAAAITPAKNKAQPIGFFARFYQFSTQFNPVLMGSFQSALKVDAVNTRSAVNQSAGVQTVTSGGVSVPVTTNSLSSSHQQVTLALSRLLGKTRVVQTTPQPARASSLTTVSVVNPPQMTSLTVNKLTGKTTVSPITTAYLFSILKPAASLSTAAVTPAKPSTVSAAATAPSAPAIPVTPASQAAASQPAATPVNTPAAANNATSNATNNPSAPKIFNAPMSARPGDIIGLQGANFGADPQAYLLTDKGQVKLERINQYDSIWASYRLPAVINGVISVQVVNGAQTSTPITLNAAMPFNIDAETIVPQGKFRLFGRNLKMAGFTPAVTVNSQPAVIDIANSTENMLLLTAPANLANANVATIRVDNGNGSGVVTFEQQPAILNVAAADPFGLGVGWTAGFANIAQRVVDPRTDSHLTNKARCDGSYFDDSAAVDEAIKYTSNTGGGVVQLPAGTCYFAKTVQLANNVVLQGAGKTSTIINYTTNFAIWGENISWSGLRNLTLRNQNMASEGPTFKKSRNILLQNVTFDMKTTGQMHLSYNHNMVVKGSDIVMQQSINEHGPVVFDWTSGLVYEGNTSSHTVGAIQMRGVHNAYIGNNVLTRDAAHQYDSGVQHMMSIDFMQRAAVMNNRFEVINGKITNKDRNDGETLLTEGGAFMRTENSGMVQSAGSNTLTDAGNLINTNPLNEVSLPENYGVAIVYGKGLGQSRRLVSYANGTMVVDRPWDVVPDTTSRYATFLWGLEKTIIANNSLIGNPRGIWLYQTAVRDVDIINNTIQEGGGIYLRAEQKTESKMFTPILGVKIANNSISNTGATWGSYLNNVFATTDISVQGVGNIGVEVRNNKIVANKVNVVNLKEDLAFNEGMMNYAKTFTDATQTAVKGQMRLLGTIFQNNACTYCITDPNLHEAAAKATVFAN